MQAAEERYNAGPCKAVVCGGRSSVQFEILFTTLLFWPAPKIKYARAAGRPTKENAEVLGAHRTPIIWKVPNPESSGIKLPTLIVKAGIHLSFHTEKVHRARSREGKTGWKPKSIYMHSNAGMNRDRYVWFRGA